MSDTDQPQSQSAQPVQPVVDNVSVTAAQKEYEPVSVAPVSAESITPSELEPQINPEVREAGVESVPHLPKLTEEHKNLGIEPAKESVPVSIQPSGKIQLPSKKEAEDMKKKGGSGDSFYWLATEFLKQILKTAFKSKKQPLET